MSEIGEIMEKLKDLEDRVSRLEESKELDVEKTKKTISIQEFLKSKSIKNDVQKTLVIGYYLEKYGMMSSFNTNDIKKGYKMPEKEFQKIFPIRFI